MCGDNSVIDYCKIHDSFSPLSCSIVDVNKVLEVRNDKQEMEVWQKRQSASLVLIVVWSKEDLEGGNLVKDAIFKVDL